MICCLHGGSYSASYFDASMDYSIKPYADAHGISVLSINRPGYGGSSPLSPSAADSDTLQDQGKHLHSVVLPALWEMFGQPNGATGFVLYGHSVGSAVAIVAAAQHAASSSPAYPLLGIITSGLGLRDPAVTEVAKQFFSVLPPDLVTNTMPPPMKDELMLKPSLRLCYPSALELTEKLNHEAPIAEQKAMLFGWDDYWINYAKEVRVPNLNGIGDHDSSFLCTEDATRAFAKAFEKSEDLVQRLLPNTPHAIELSKMCKAWYLYCTGFAVECAVRHSFAKSREG